MPSAMDKALRSSGGYTYPDHSDGAQQSAMAKVGGGWEVVQERKWPSSVCSHSCCDLAVLCTSWGSPEKQN